MALPLKQWMFNTCCLCSSCWRGGKLQEKTEKTIRFTHALLAEDAFRTHSTQPALPAQTLRRLAPGREHTKERIKKEKNQLNLCDFGLNAEQSPSPPLWGCTPQTHLLLLGNVPPHGQPASLGKVTTMREVPWWLAAGTGFLSQCFALGSCTPCNAVWRYPESWGDTVALQSLKTRTRSWKRGCPEVQLQHHPTNTDFLPPIPKLLCHQPVTSPWEEGPGWP